MATEVYELYEMAEFALRDRGYRIGLVRGVYKDNTWGNVILRDIPERIGIYRDLRVETNDSRYTGIPNATVLGSKNGKDTLNIGIGLPNNIKNLDRIVKKSKELKTKLVTEYPDGGTYTDGDWWGPYDEY